MVMDLLKKAKRKAAFGVENATSAPGRMLDNRRLRKANETIDKAMGETGIRQRRKMQEAGKTMQEVSENNKTRLNRLRAIDYYSKK